MSTELAYLKSALDDVLLPDLINLINQFKPDIIIDNVSYMQKNILNEMLKNAKAIHFYSTFQILDGMRFFNIEKMTGTPTIIATSFNMMFYGARKFNCDLSGWDVSSVQNMRKMFTEAISFKGDLSGWDVSSVIDMSDMFCCARKFNCDLSGWDVSSVVDMGDMFCCARKFNCDLSGWDVSSATDMCGMFVRATSFNLANKPRKRKLRIVA